MNEWSLFHDAPGKNADFQGVDKCRLEPGMCVYSVTCFTQNAVEVV